MKTPLVFGLVVSGLGLAAVSSAHAQAQDVARVVSSVPVMQQVAVPRQSCTQQPVVVEQPRSGAGALVGAIVGGLAGHGIGGGMGQAAATGIGAVAGAMVGDRLEAPHASVQQATQCATQNFYENRVVGYNVTYEYAGKQYMVQMPQDPGPTLHLQLTPMAPSAPMSDAAPQAPVAPLVSAPSVVPAPQPAVIIRDVVTAPAPVTYYAPYPAYAAYPGYYYRPWYPSVSLSLGYVHRSGGHRHRR